MSFYADLHVHSKYSRATSRDCDLEHLSLWAQRKGLTVVGTGDFTHPAWFDEIRDKLIPAEPGLFRLRPSLEREVERQLPATCRSPMRFMLEVEISTIYKKGDRTRKVHHLIYAPDLDTAGRFRDRLGSIGNIASDGRPILGLDSRHLLEITLESGPGAYLVPAHIWTPWFAVLGSKSGFDSVAECYGDLAEHIFAVETGLSSDPPMNWRVSDLDRYTLVSNSDAHSPPKLGREACVFDTPLDYFAIRHALETGAGYGGTIEFFPEEGKYHLDGHRACGVCLEPEETRRRDGRCPQCGKPLTVGVMHRVELLADRPEGARPDRAAPFRSLVPLPEIVSEIEGVGPRSKTVQRKVAELSSRLGPELAILDSSPLEEVGQSTGELFREAIGRLRSGRVHRQSGYDGEYGTIRLFEPDELASRKMVTPLFDFHPQTVAVPPKSPHPEEKATARPRNLATQVPHPVPGAPNPLPHPPSTPSPGEGAASHPRSPATPQNPREPSVLDALDPDQRTAAEIVSGPLLIIAGPGTGKTRTLTHRLAYMVTAGIAAPEECLAITFTRRAAEEMRERLAALMPEDAQRVTVTTFHGLGLQILRRHRAELGLERGFRIAGEAERLDLIREIYEVSRTQAGRLAEEIGRARRGDGVEALSTRDLSTRDRPTRDRPVVDPAPYLKALRDRDLVDFDDLLALTVELLEDRAEVLAATRRRFRWLSIDEYQDVDALQYRLVRLLAPDAAGICAIGDPDQSIYRFRGADVGFFLRFQQDYPAARTVELRRNYRSSRAIVDAALQAIAPASLVAGRALTAMVDDGVEHLVVHTAASEKAEAEHVVQSIEQLLGGTSYFSLDSGRVGDDGDDALSFDDFAVLYRTDAQSVAVIEALERAGIPFQKRSHSRLADCPEVRQLLEALREDIERRATLPLLTLPVAARLDAASRRLAEDSKDAAAITAARDLLAPLAVRCGDDVERFLAEVALGAEVDTWDPRAERVSLLTLHAAKGLEFAVVFIVGCVDGLLPFRRDGGDTDLDEERRLFFVGMTRARSRLILSHARRRRWRGQVLDCIPSPFLEDIDEALLERRHGRRPAPKEEEQGPRQLSLL
ncbi:MAG: UvrD-helicase domain-containing protein [Thermoanaerobaculia bacterium]